MTQRIQQFPGLTEFLLTRVATVLPLQAARLAEPLSQLTQNLGEDVQRITQASVNSMPSAPAEDLHVELATHLLTDGIAQPLSAFSSYIDSTNGEPKHPKVNIAYSQQATSHSDQRITVGTSVTIDDKHYQAIKVI